jgi:hypothetical protein
MMYTYIVSRAEEHSTDPIVIIHVCFYLERIRTVGSAVGPNDSSHDMSAVGAIPWMIFSYRCIIGVGGGGGDDERPQRELHSRQLQIKKANR